MATDIFSREVSFGGAFSADGASLTFSNFGQGLLAQQVQWQYQQNVTRLYEVASPDIWLVAGRTQGQATVQRVMGPSSLAASFYETYGNVCNTASNTITFTFTAACDAADTGGDTVTVTLNGVVIVGVGGAVTAQDMVVNESITMLFLWMTYDDGQGGP